MNFGPAWRDAYVHYVSEEAAAADPFLAHAAGDRFFSHIREAPVGLFPEHWYTLSSKRSRSTLEKNVFSVE